MDINDILPDFRAILPSEPQTEFVFEVGAYPPEAGPPIAVREIARGEINNEPYTIYLSTDNRFLILRHKNDQGFRRVMRLDRLLTQWVTALAKSGSIGMQMVPTAPAA